MIARAFLFLSAMVLASSAAQAKIYTTTPIQKPPDQAKAETDTFLRGVYGNALNPYLFVPLRPTFEEHIRGIVREELERQEKSGN